MNREIEERLAALAVGAADATEAVELAAQLAAKSELRDEFAAYQKAVDYLAISALESAAKPNEEQKRRMLSRIVAEAAAGRRKPLNGDTSLVPNELLLPYARGVQWAVIPGDGITIAFLVFNPSQCTGVPLETHDQDECGYVLEGACSLWYPDGERQDLATGDYYMVPAGKPHGAIFHERTVLFDVFNPANVEFERSYAEQLAAT